MRRAAFDEARDQRIADETPAVRTDYRCRAHGCPNAGSMAGDLCYHHWRAEPMVWPFVTQEICENFDAMRNWGQASPELLARRRAESQRKFGQSGRKPMGLVQSGRSE